MSFFKPEDFRGSELSKLEAAEVANKKLKESGYLDYILQAELNKQKQLELPLNDEPEFESVDYFFKHPTAKNEVIGLHFTYYSPLLPNEDYIEAWVNVYKEDGTFRFSSYRISNKAEDEIQSYLDDGFEAVKDFKPMYPGRSK